MHLAWCRAACSDYGLQYTVKCLRVLLTNVRKDNKKQQVALRKAQSRSKVRRRGVWCTSVVVVAAH